MKVSYNWLKKYVKNLPKPEKVEELLTMHAFEIEGVEKVKNDTVIDVSVLPNRAHDCLCHLGIAKEISALAGLGKLSFHLEAKLPSKGQVRKVEVINEAPDLCPRYIARAMEGVKNGPTPTSLKDPLEAIGQRSITSLVDATNFVMFEMGQPLHAFDADKLSGNKIIVRRARPGEKFTTLDNQEFELDENVLVIADEQDALAIAGIKGGKKAEIDANTKNIIIECANFNSINTRITSQKLGLRTESSVRYENAISPELAEKGMDRVSEIIFDLNKKAKVGAKIDFYPRRANQFVLGLYPDQVEKVLGIKVEEKEIIEKLKSLGFEVKKLNPLKNVLALANKFKNVPHKYGASISYDAPKQFDCSSFTSYIFAQSGIQIPRVSIDQFVFSKPISEKELKPGDLIFSNTGVLINKIHYETVDYMPGTKVEKGADHCGVYLGKGKIIHVSSGNNGAKIEDYKKTKQFKKITGFGRVILRNDDVLVVSVPSERLDVRRKEDLIEEIGRLHGFYKIPSVLPEETLIPAKRNDNVAVANLVRDIMVGAGFSEILNYSFGKNGEVELANPIDKNKRFMKTELLPDLREKLKQNEAYFKSVKIFEINKVFYKTGENTNFAGVMSNASFYDAKGAVELVLEKLGLEDYYFDLPAEALAKEGGSKEKTADIRAGNTSIGHIDINGWEINFDMLVRLVSEEKEFQPIPKYPATKRDVAVFVPLETRMTEVEDVIENAGGPLLYDSDLFDVFEKDAEGKKSLAFHLIFQSFEKTLSDTEVNELMAKIMQALEANSGWEVRK